MHQYLKTMRTPKAMIEVCDENSPEELQIILIAPVELAWRGNAEAI